MEAEKCQIFKTFYVIIFVVKSISFQLLLHFMCFYSRFYFVSVLQNISVFVSVSLNENMSISVSVSISVNEYITGVNALWASCVICPVNSCQTCIDKCNIRFPRYKSSGIRYIQSRFRYNADSIIVRSLINLPLIYYSAVFFSDSC